MNRFVALSLSFAVKDLLTNRVPLDAVEYVVPNFAWPGLQNWLADECKPFDRYMDTYWSYYANRESVLELLAKLRFNSASHQFNIAQGYWWPIDSCRDLALVLDDNDLRFTTDEICQLLHCSRAVLLYASVGKPIVAQETREMRIEELKKIRLDVE